jgi:hypothetical protein
VDAALDREDNFKLLMPVVGHKSAGFIVKQHERYQGFSGVELKEGIHSNASILNLLGLIYVEAP